MRSLKFKTKARCVLLSLVIQTVPAILPKWFRSSYNIHMHRFHTGCIIISTARANRLWILEWHGTIMDISIPISISTSILISVSMVA